MLAGHKFVQQEGESSIRHLWNRWKMKYLTSLTTLGETNAGTQLVKKGKNKGGEWYNLSMEQIAISNFKFNYTYNVNNTIPAKNAYMLIYCRFKMSSLYTIKKKVCMHH